MEEFEVVEINKARESGILRRRCVCGGGRVGGALACTYVKRFHAPRTNLDLRFIFSFKIS